MQRALEINLLHSRGKEESEDLENFKKHHIELNDILKSADRPSVKDVTVSEISIPLAKTESLNELAPDKAKSGKQWSDVVAGRRKSSHTRQIISQPIPVIMNCYELKHNDYECGLDTTRLMGVQQMEGKCKFKKEKTDKGHKITITEDSHTRGL